MYKITVKNETVGVVNVEPSHTVGVVNAEPSRTVGVVNTQPSRNVAVITAPKGFKGEKGDPATVSVGTTSTGAAGTSASVTNSGTAADAILDFTIPRGEQGDPGEGVPVGGTTGQALIKDSNSDYDTIWSDDPYARANHTGTQTASTISDFNSTVTSTINSTVDKTFVDNLNVDADTLDGIDSTGFATAAQGNTADTAVQPGDLGTAATTDSTDYATAAQGDTADTAVQPGDFTNTLGEIDDATDAVQLAKAEEATDTTAGRLLKVGDFGVGLEGDIGNTAGTSTDSSDALIGGRFSTLASDEYVDGLSVPTGFRGCLLTLPGNFANRAQLMVDRININMWFRGYTLGTFTPWRELYHTGNTIVDGNGFIKEA